MGARGSTCEPERTVVALIARERKVVYARRYNRVIYLACIRSEMRRVFFFMMHSVLDISWGADVLGCLSIVN